MDKHAAAKIETFDLRRIKHEISNNSGNDVARRLVFDSPCGDEERPMKVVRNISAIGAATMFLFAAQTGLAGPPSDLEDLMCSDGTITSDCSALATLCMKIEYADVPPLRQRTRNGLITKVFDIDLKLRRNKTDKAGEKLEGMDDTLHKLNGAPKDKIASGDFLLIHEALVTVETECLGVGHSTPI
jgi:hypothetical protein